jgi:peptidoglycan/LPS O-acetylase OafA/YrhL
MTPHRYDVLDALRGVAALMVLLFHMETEKLVPAWLPHGYLAVDFFFIVSGVVIAQSYEARFATALDLRGFVMRRAIRVFPLVALGVLIGSSVRLVRLLVAPDLVDPLDQVLVSSVLNAVLIPMVYGSEVASRALFPSDGPLWSLFFELAVNLIWAVWLVGRRTRVLVALVLVAALLDAGCIRHWGSANIGWDRDSFFAGFPRVIYGFTTGVLLYRWRQHLRWPAWRYTEAALAATLVLIALPAPDARWDMLCVFMLLPLLVGAGMGQSSHRVGSAIGNGSYPIYVLHFPLMMAVMQVHRAFPALVPTRFLAPLIVAVVLGGVWLVLRVYDTPVRGALSRRWLGPESSLPAAQGMVGARWAHDSWQPVNGRGR